MTPFERELGCDGSGSKACSRLRRAPCSTTLEGRNIAMPRPNDTWKVLPHSPLTRVGENLYTATGKLRMPLGETTRRMTVVRLSGGRLAIYSAIALNEIEMAKLEALGKPTYLVVPSAIHRLDAKPWCERYPDLVVLAPRGSRDKVSEIVGVSAADTDLGDPRVRLVVVPGTRDQEFAMVVDTDTGKTLVVNDLIFNLPAIPGLAGLGLRWLGFGPGRAVMPKLVMMKLVEDKAAVRTQLEEWAQLADLERVLVSHGAPLDDPRNTLLQLAGALA
jgi:hypothetical protein